MGRGLWDVSSLRFRLRMVGWGSVAAVGFRFRGWHVVMLCRLLRGAFWRSFKFWSQIHRRLKLGKIVKHGTFLHCGKALKGSYLELHGS